MDLVIALDSKNGLSLHRQLYEELRRSILSGRLLPGQRIPSTRAMARSLGISRTTVTQSYEELLSEGYLQTSHGSGTFICHQLPEELLRAAQSGSAPGIISSKAARSKKRTLQLSSYGSSLAAALPIDRSSKGILISFRNGVLDFDAVPLKQWSRLIARHCRTGRREMLDYTDDSMGYRPLREAIAQYLGRSRAVSCEADQVIIVSGSQQGLDLISRVMINRGDDVAMEDPGYLGARRSFQAHGARLCPVPVDESGLMVDHLSAKMKLLYVTPSHQFPTGAVLSLTRRLELLSWAQQTGAIIIEDDYDSEYRYDGRPIPALQGLDQNDSVVYIGTFSKVLFPALRIAYMVAPRSLTTVIARAKQLADRQSPSLEQYALTDFINSGYLERHIRRMRTLYGQRRQALARALVLHFGERINIIGEKAGMHFMARIETGMSEDEATERAARAGVELVSVRPFCLQAECDNRFVLGFSGLGLRKIQEGVKRLYKALVEKG
jgi:GntR family transcriptional regulator / MocR family aminotransferase